MRAFAERCLTPLAVFITTWYRRFFLRRVAIVGITGSCGKTSTKELIAAILSAHLRGKANRATQNGLTEILRVMWSTSPSDDYLLQEVSIGGVHLQLGPKARMLRPTVGVITNIGTDHISAFGSKEAIATEKAQLVEAMPKESVAILNADDEHVLRMSSKCPGRIFTYGLSESADVRAVNIESTWPECLRFTVVHNGSETAVQMQLCGDHWVHSVLAAIATGLSLGVSLEDAAAALASAEPFQARMCPVPLSNGVTFIRDDWKAPLWTVEASLRFMRQAKAKRKVVVVGTLSDYRGAAASKYVAVAEEALDSADQVFFVGPWASRSLRARPKDGQTLRAFANVKEAIPYLESFLQADDLVLLKGSHAADFLVRIVTAIDQLDLETRDSEQVQGGSRKFRRDGVQVVVGLGNPDREFDGTPHNMGKAIVDLMTKQLQIDFTDEGPVKIARCELDDQLVWLVKPNVLINDCGDVLRDFAEQQFLGPQDLIVVQDDINLAIGAIKSRMKGSAGGHKGVSSILSAFQTESIRRVKVGVGRPESAKEVVRYVTSRFSRDVQRDVENACQIAAARVFELLSDPLRGEHNKTKPRRGRAKSS